MTEGTPLPQRKQRAPLQRRQRSPQATDRTETNSSATPGGRPRQQRRAARAAAHRSESSPSPFFIALFYCTSRTSGATPGRLKSGFQVALDRQSRFASPLRWPRHTAAISPDKKSAPTGALRVWIDQAILGGTTTQITHNPGKSATFRDQAS